MAIEKESSGVPEVDFKRPTTKVNLGIIIGAGLFYLITFAIVYFFAAKDDRPTASPTSPLEAVGDTNTGTGSEAGPNRSGR